MKNVSDKMKVKQMSDGPKLNRRALFAGAAAVGATAAGAARAAGDPAILEVQPWAQELGAGPRVSFRGAEAAGWAWPPGPDNPLEG